MQRRVFISATNDRSLDDRRRALKTAIFAILQQHKLVPQSFFEAGIAENMAWIGARTASSSGVAAVSVAARALRQSAAIAAERRRVMVNDCSPALKLWMEPHKFRCVP